jgi:hypothetical protein
MVSVRPHGISLPKHPVEREWLFSRTSTDWRGRLLVHEVAVELIGATVPPRSRSAPR